MTLRSKLVVACAIEFFYVVVRNHLLRSELAPIPGEIALTLIRIAVVAVDWLMFRDLVRSMKPNLGPIKQGLFALGCLVVLVEVVLKPSPGAGIPLSERLVFMATSFVVGWREELFYRGVLQNVFDRKWGPAVAIVVSNALFVLYHVGTAPFVMNSITQWFLLGLVSAFIYLVTRSVLLVAVVHGLYDALISGGPYVASPISFSSIVLLELLAVAFLGVWAWRDANLKW